MRNSRPLFFSVAALGLATAAVLWLDQQDQTAPSDPLVGQQVLADSVAAEADNITISNPTATINLNRSTAGHWTVNVEGQPFPADFARLNRMVDSLLSQEVSRIVTANPQRIERLGFGETSMRFAAGEATLADIAFGSTAETGGQFVRFTADGPAYLIPNQVWLSGNADAWRDRAFVSFEPDSIRSIELSSATFTRSSADAPFVRTTANEASTAENDAGSDDAAAVATFLRTVANLRYNRLEPTDAAAVTATMPLRSSALFTTADGTQWRISWGRTPEVPAPENTEAMPWDPAASGEEPVVPQTIPQGPAIVWLEMLPDNDPWQQVAQQFAFVIADFSFDQLNAVAM
jgi:hypothetical protein